MSTIDPGMEEPVKDASNDIEDSSDEERQQEEEEEEFRNPSRWWFASTACPLLAGTFGPIASGFNICALVFNWRVYIPPEGTEEHGIKIRDPRWLVAINAVSLLFAVGGNLSLLMNMAKRMKFSIAQPITITGFLMAGVLLVADLAAITSSPTYFLTGKYAPGAAHALTSAFYYAIFAAAFYIIIGLLMCFTVYGANRGYYDKSFNLTSSQRSLMLQTMLFITYLLLGALVFSKIEGWEYLNTVYWADVTLLTVGLGDYSPATATGKGLLFPFALGGILIIGLVIGSIRSLVLERGREKMSARIAEKRRSKAVHNVDDRKQTIKISWFAQADFSTNPALSPAQRREEEFTVMRKVQDTAESERRWLALFSSIIFALILWLAGAAIFMVAEKNQGWTYFQSLYFTYVCLLTIGYGDFRPMSNSGHAFFVVWSLLAVPSLTILISNMGDTVVKWFSDATVWVGEITVLPGEHGVRAKGKSVLQSVITWLRNAFSRWSPPGIMGESTQPESGHHEKRTTGDEHEERMMDRLAERLHSHIADEDLRPTRKAEKEFDPIERDMNFYHYVLAREIRNLQKDLSASPTKKYSWPEWEYFLKLMGNEDDPEDFPGQKQPDILVPEQLRMAPSTGSAATLTDGTVDRETEVKEWKKEHEAHKKQGKLRSPERKKRSNTIMNLRDWSWLSAKSPLMATVSETEWILDRLAAALERELNRQRKGYKKQPPISLDDVKRKHHASGSKQGTDEGAATNRVQGKQEQSLGTAARGEA